MSSSFVRLWRCAACGHVWADQGRRKDRPSQACPACRTATSGELKLARQARERSLQELTTLLENVPGVLL